MDDDRAILGLLEETLRSAGYSVLVANGGWEAVQVYEHRREPIHLLLTDVIMPDLTGPVLAERLCAQQPDLRVVFISGFHDADLVHRFASRRGFTLLPKPFAAGALLRAVEESLSGVTPQS